MDKETEKISKSLTSQQRNETSKELLLLLKNGKDSAANELFDRYASRLIALAGSRIGTHLQRRIDPEDIVQSAYGSFFLRAAEGDFTWQKSGDLWRLLAQITLNKLYSQAERHTAAKRDVRSEAGASSSSWSQLSPLAAKTLSPEEEASCLEGLGDLLAKLPDDVRQTLTWYLKGESLDSIAQRLGRAPRTIRRQLQALREQLEAGLQASYNDAEAKWHSLPRVDELLDFSDFHLHQFIGAGGTGKVYRGTQKSTGNTVAIKSLRKCMLRSKRAVQQFLHEASVVQGVQHPGVIQIAGLGQFPSGGYFLVMPYVAGGDLARRLQQGPIPHRAALNVFAQLVKAIAFAHQHGVVHCDLKPANVLVDTGWRVVVTDFGFAHLITGPASSMPTGGTLGYMAPEFLRSHDPPTPAADIYSLGAILRELVGRSSSVDLLIEQCLASDPNKRPTAIELSVVLSSLLADSLTKSE